jgi:dienelactone hydrolase
VEAAIDAAVAGPWNADADRIGVLGHSFGAVTAGRVTATDDRISALFAAGAPIDNPILPGADAAAITTPTMLLLLEEDHSVGEAGNILIEQNYDELASPAWLARMPDGGHWSVSDLCGITEDFMPGCGEDTREAGGGTFTYVPADDGRAAAASLASAFFAATLGGDADAAAWLEAPETAAAVEVETTAP